MEFVKLKVGLRDDPKMIGLSDRAFRAYITALCWSGEHETDGMLPAGLIPARLATELRKAGLLDGLGIHNWAKHQVTHAEMDAKRIAGRNAARSRWGNTTSNTEVRGKRLEVEVEPKTAADGAHLDESSTLAAALLASDSTAQYLISRMDEKWQLALTSGALMKLGKKYGAAILTDALRNMREEDAGPEEPYPYLEKVCVRLTGAPSVA